MIHKFVLERCVRCNLPLDALEQSGWDCKGHSASPPEEDPLWDLDSPLPVLVDPPPYSPAARIPSYEHEPLSPYPGDDLLRDSLSPYRQWKSPPPQIQQANQKTDIFAVICFSTGLLGFWILPLLFTPVSFISGIISYYRLKDNPDLKGKGLRLAGAILASLSMIWLFLQFRNSY